MVFLVLTRCFGFFKYLFSFVFLCFLVVLFLNTVLKKSLELLLHSNRNIQLRNHQNLQLPITEIFN